MRGVHSRFGQFEDGLVTSNNVMTSVAAIIPTLNEEDGIATTIRHARAGGSVAARSGECYVNASALRRKKT